MMMPGVALPVIELVNSTQLLTEIYNTKIDYYLYSWLFLINDLFLGLGFI